MGVVVKSTRNLNKSVIAAAIAVAFAAPAFAQQAPEQIQRVEITGSSIKQSAREAAGAVTTLTRADIERTGQTSALGVLTQIAAIDTNINSATASSGSFATGSFPGRRSRIEERDKVRIRLTGASGEPTGAGG